MTALHASEYDTLEYRNSAHFFISHEEKWHAVAEVPDFGIPAGLDAEETLWRVDSEDDDYHVSVRIALGPQSIVGLLPRRVPHAEPNLRSDNAFFNMTERRGHVSSSYIILIPSPFLYPYIILRTRCA